jgi:hypothetical protein
VNGVKLELLKLALASHLSKDAHEPVNEHDMTFVCEGAIELLNEREKFVDLRDQIEAWLRTPPPGRDEWGEIVHVLDQMTTILEDNDVLEVWKV